MDKILTTFYKGNSRRFGTSTWNTIKDDYNFNITNNNYNDNYGINTNNLNNIDISKSQPLYNIHQPKPKYNHLSPNLIKIQYFNNYLEQFEHRRNLHMQDYINNGIYNVYEGTEDPLSKRRKDVQDKLTNVRNKLLKEESERFERRMEKVAKENRMLDDLILEREYDVNYNKNKDEVALHLLEDFDDKDFEKIYNKKENKKPEEIKSFKSEKNSYLILSRTHSSASSNIDMLASSDDENDKVLEIKRRQSIVVSPKKDQKEEKFGRRRSSLFNANIRNSLRKTSSKSIDNNNQDNTNKNKDKKKIFKEYQHTDILKILSNLDKYSIPIDNVNKELINQSKTAPMAFQELYKDIEELKLDFENKMEKYHTQNKNNIAALNEVLYELKIKKNYMELQADLYKPKIEQIIENAIDKYTQRRFENDFEENMLNERLNMENDFVRKMKLTERATNAKKIANNLTNEVENVDNIFIKPKKFENDMVSNLSRTGKNSIDLVNIKSNNSKEDTNSKNDIFPALKGLNESHYSNHEIKSKINSNISDNKKSKISNKKRKRKEKRNVEIRDLGEVGDDYFLYKDNNKIQKERKETIIEHVNKNYKDLYKKES